MTLLRTMAVNILEAALREEVGVTCDVTTLKDISGPSLRAAQVLYRFRSELSPRFDCLRIKLSKTNPERELWVYRESEAEPESEPTPESTNASNL